MSATEWVTKAANDYVGFLQERNRKSALEELHARMRQGTVDRIANDGPAEGKEFVAGCSTSPRGMPRNSMLFANRPY